MLSETRERFARAIMAQVPPERIVEIHFFQPIKQGGVESGVAVFATTPDVPPSPDAGSLARAPDDCVVIPAHSVEPPELEVPIAVHGDVTSDYVMDADAPDEPPTSSSRADPDDASDDAYPPDELRDPRAEEARKRFVVYTARYRLVLKGIDRGKWEASVVAEADAPLATVDLVVRGVLRRAGDAEDAERMTGEELRMQLAALAK
jgi:hypothetical protein